MTTTIECEPLVQTLSRSQFAEFCCEIWNTPACQGWKESNDALWKGILEFELRRGFDEGWQYCESAFQITPEGGRHWWYKTTSGTILEVKQPLMGHGRELPEPTFTVEIPSHRKEGHHACLLEQALGGSTYFEWYSLFYSVEGTPAFEEARRRGMAIASDKEKVG